MTLNKGFAPHLRRTERASYMSLDVLITLIPLCIFSSVYYGFRPVLLVLTGMITAMACELLCCAFLRRRPTLLDGTAAVTGRAYRGHDVPADPVLGAGAGGRLRHRGGQDALRRHRPQCLQPRRRRHGGGHPLLFHPAVPLSGSLSKRASRPERRFGKGPDRDVPGGPAGRRRLPDLQLGGAGHRPVPRPYRRHLHRGAGRLRAVSVHSTHRLPSSSPCLFWLSAPCRPSCFPG